MWFSRASTRFGLFALLLGIIVLSLFGSVVAADRALVGADQRSVELDARNAAAIVERELRVRVEPLSALPSAQSALTPEANSALAYFDAVWVLDMRGRVLWQRGGAGQSDSSVPAEIGRMTVGTSWPRVRALHPAAPTHTGSLLVAVPLRNRGQQSGTAVGRVLAARVLQVVPNPPRESWIALRTGTALLASSGSRSGGSELEASSPVAVSGDKLEIRVAHAQSGRALRGTLWVLSALALAALWAGLVRERQQALHVAGRTEELERLYQEVAKANRMKSEFLANISHELRTPLNAIVGFAEMLKDGTYGELTPRQALPVDRIASSTAHLRELVDRLLDIGKIAAGRIEVHPEEMSLSRFVLDIVAEMEPLLNERGLAMSINVGSSLPRIKTDPAHLRQIFINLLGNAVKYTAAGGIQIRAKVVGNRVALQVSDTGVGIAEEDRERVFDEFEQVNAGARSDSARRGTGLGLAISRRLARLLGGDLTVVSEPGRGSTFTVWLSLDAATDSRA